MTYIKIKTTTEKEEVTLFPLKILSLILLAIGVLLINLMLLNDSKLNTNHIDVVDNDIPATYQQMITEP